MPTESDSCRPAPGVSGQVVLITGAANGIGAETARQLISRGARVALLDRDEVALKQLAVELGDATAAFVADVTQAHSVDAAVQAAVERFGGIDVVVANAGMFRSGRDGVEVDPLDFEQIVEINLLGVFRTVRAALPYVCARRGYVLMVSSIMALIQPYRSGLRRDQGGRLRRSAEALQVELADKGCSGRGCLLRSDRHRLGARRRVDHRFRRCSGARCPGSWSKPAPVARGASVMVSGITRRANRVFAPGLRPRVARSARLRWRLADRLLSRNRNIKNIIRRAACRRHSWTTGSGHDRW